VARCDERCTLRLSGRMTGRRRLPSVTRRAAAGKRVRLTMKLSRRLRRTLARDLRRGRKVIATLRLRARDAAGNARTRTVRVRVVR
jgi:hypothetical protein